MVRPSRAHWGSPLPPANPPRLRAVPSLPGVSGVETGEARAVLADHVEAGTALGCAGSGVPVAPPPADRKA